MQTSSRLKYEKKFHLAYLGVFADDGEMVFARVTSTIQHAVQHIRLTAADAAMVVLEEFRLALLTLLQIFQKDRHGSKEVFKLAISLLPKASGA